MVGGIESEYYNRKNLIILRALEPFRENFPLYGNKLQLDTPFYYITHGCVSDGSSCPVEALDWLHLR